MVTNGDDSTSNPWPSKAIWMNFWRLLNWQEQSSQQVWIFRSLNSAGLKDWAYFLSWCVCMFQKSWTCPSLMQRSTRVCCRQLKRNLWKMRKRRTKCSWASHEGQWAWFTEDKTTCDKKFFFALHLPGFYSDPTGMKRRPQKNWIRRRGTHFWNGEGNWLSECVFFCSLKCSKQSKMHVKRADCEILLLSRLQEKEHLILTPFERNLDFWRQLWRVIERRYVGWNKTSLRDLLQMLPICALLFKVLVRIQNKIPCMTWHYILFSDVVVQIVDARNPLLFYCEDLASYVRSMGKVDALLINKADLLTEEQR